VEAALPVLHQSTASTRCADHVAPCLLLPLVSLHCIDATSSSTRHSLQILVAGSATRRCLGTLSVDMRCIMTL
jgi:hypothetical protein